MAKTKIDPAFQAAPYLGDSSHDPIEFTRRHAMIKYQAKVRKEEETERNIAKGLDLLAVDLKGWDDKEGFAEIQKRQDKAYRMYMDLATKGVNFVTPKTTADVTAYKALTDYQTETKQLADIRNTHKILIETAEKSIKDDLARPEEERRWDEEGSRKMFTAALKDNTLTGRGKLMNNLLVPKVQIGDVVKQVIADKGFYIPPTQTQVVTPNPETGVNETTFVEDMPEADVKENVRRAGVRYSGLTEAMKKGVRQMREAETDPVLRVMQDKDYYATLAVPTYRKKFLEKVTGTGGGINFSFLGTKDAKITPGKFHVNDQIYGGRNYNQRYDFSANKTFKVPTTGGFQHDSDPNPKIQGDDGWHEIKGGDDVEAELRFYDPKTDMIIFRSGQAAQNPWVMNNTTFAVPRKNVPDSDKLPVMINGKTRTLKDILPKEPETKQLPLPANFWSTPTYIPKSKK